VRRFNKNWVDEKSGFGFTSRIQMTIELENGGGEIFSKKNKFKYSQIRLLGRFGLALFFRSVCKIFIV